MTDFQTKDSGERQKFDTGAQRDTQTGKPRYDLIPSKALERVAGLYARGAEKYDEWNWAKGIPVSRNLASLDRHLNQYIQGDRDEDHLAAVVWNALAIIHYEEYRHLYDHLFDLPDFNASTLAEALRLEEKSPEVDDEIDPDSYTPPSLRESQELRELATDQQRQDDLQPLGPMR